MVAFLLPLSSYTCIQWSASLVTNLNMHVTIIREGNAIYSLLYNTSNCLYWMLKSCFCAIIASLYYIEGERTILDMLTIDGNGELMLAYSSTRQGITETRYVPSPLSVTGHSSLLQVSSDPPSANAFLLLPSCNDLHLHLCTNTQPLTS